MFYRGKVRYDFDSYFFLPTANWTFSPDWRDALFNALALTWLDSAPDGATFPVFFASFAMANALVASELCPACTFPLRTKNGLDCIA